MSEPQNKPVDELMKPTAPTAEQVSEEQVPITLPSSDNQAQANPTEDNNAPTHPELTGDVKTLKDAFPDLDVDVIETILASQDGSLDAAFETLLGMSDPTYKPEPVQSESMNQLRQDEEYARRLAREGDAHYPQNNTRQQVEQPLFNFQEELPIIKERVIEAGTAAKNKIMNLYNQFMAPDQSQQQRHQSSQGGILETGMGNLSLSDNQSRATTPPPPPPRQQSRTVPPVASSGDSGDLYEWNGRAQSPVRNNPLLSNRKESVTSTSAEQLLSDEEFARQLAREDAENQATLPPVPAPKTTTTPTAVDSPTTTNKNDRTTTSSDNEEVTFTALSDGPKSTGYTHTEDDDLDDLFDKQDSNLDLSTESMHSFDKEPSTKTIKK